MSKDRKNNTDKNETIKFYFVSGEMTGAHQECEFISDEQIEQMMSETHFGYIESYA